MNIKLDSNLAKVKINGTEVDKVKYNGAVVWTKPAARGIYGVSWSGTGSGTVALTRTDDAVGLADPVPYVNNGTMVAADCSSPFDTIAPWKDIQIETIGNNTCVKIPKFWYKITYGGSPSHITKIQIANYAETGFAVSPAHADRGYGEQDFIWVDRYINNTNYESVTGVTDRTATQIKRGTARTNVRAIVIPNKHAELFDYALLQTIWMLYLVEFAHTDSQAKIGAGLNSSFTTGDTNSMPYHTGTMGNARGGGYGSGAVQYRHMENLWGYGAFCWLDGIKMYQQNSSNYMRLLIQDKFADYDDNNMSSSIGITSVFSSNNIAYLFKNTITGNISDLFIPYTGAGSSSQYNVIFDYCAGPYSSQYGQTLGVTTGGDYYSQSGLFRLMGTAQLSTATARIRKQFVNFVE